MLTPDQYDRAADAILDLYHDFEELVLADIARRLMRLNFSSAAWQAQRLTESGALYDDVLRRLSELTGASERQVAEILRRTGVQAMRFDDSLYRAAGMNPLPLNLSPQMLSVLALNVQRTAGSMNNLTRTTAYLAQQSFIRAADLAYMQVSTGAMSYDQAIRAAVISVGDSGASVVYPSGHVDKLDVAMRRTVLTGVGQLTGDLQMERAREMGQDLVRVSAHAGARPSHAIWQGKVFSISGADKRYEHFDTATGRGTVTGLEGVNCRHSWYPFFAGISENAYNDAMREQLNDRTVEYNGKQMSLYDATQVQRSIERNIRHWKRREVALSAAGLDDVFESSKVREWQARMRGFLRQTGLSRQGVRERI